MNLLTFNPSVDFSCAETTPLSPHSHRGPFRHTPLIVESRKNHRTPAAINSSFPGSPRGEDLDLDVTLKTPLIGQLTPAQVSRARELNNDLMRICSTHALLMY